MGSCASTTGGGNAVNTPPATNGKSDTAQQRTPPTTHPSVQPSFTNGGDSKWEDVLEDDKRQYARGNGATTAATMGLASTTSTPGGAIGSGTNAALPRSGLSSDSLQHSSSSLVSSCSTATTFNSREFGTFLSECDSAGLFSSSDEDSDEDGGATGRYGQFYAGGAAFGANTGAKNEMENFYNDYVRKFGGGRNAAKATSQRPTTMDLLRNHESGQAFDGGRGVSSSNTNKSTSKNDGTNRTGTSARGGGGGGASFYASTFGADSGTAATSRRHRSSRRHNKKKKRKPRVRDPVDPQRYVCTLYEFCRERMRGGKIVVDPDGEMRRLYPTHGWHRLKPLKNEDGTDGGSQGSRSPYPADIAGGRDRGGTPTDPNPIKYSTTRDNALLPNPIQRSTGSRLPGPFGDSQVSPRANSQTPVSPYKERPSATKSSFARDGKPSSDARIAAFAAARKPTNPILMKTSSFRSLSPQQQQRTADMEAAEEEQRRTQFASQRRRVSFAEDTADFRIPKREVDGGALGGYSDEQQQQAQQQQQREEEAAMQQQLGLLKGKMRAAQA